MLLKDIWYYIGLDVHKKTVSYSVKDASGQVHQEGQIGATRWELDGWMKTLPQPWTVAMEAVARKVVPAATFTFCKQRFCPCFVPVPKERMLKVAGSISPDVA